MKKYIIKNIIYNYNSLKSIVDTTEKMDIIKMIIYHYAKVLIPEIKTLLQQGISSERKAEIDRLSKARGSRWPYYDSVSFFIEPIPVDIIHTLFSEHHPVWVLGMQLYQYEVEVNSLDLKYWTMVESKIDNLLNPFYPDIKLLNPLHAKLKSTVKGFIGESGVDTGKLISAVRPYLGKTREAYLRAGKTDSTQYAAGVPHLMVYPKTPILYRKVSLVTVGSDTVRVVPTASANW